MPIETPPTGSGGGGGGVSSEVVTLSSAQLLALTTGAPDSKLVNAPSAGQLIVPLAFILELVFATTPYTVNTGTADIEFVVGPTPATANGSWGPVTTAEATALNGSFAAAASSVYVNVPPRLSSSLNADVLGQAIWLFDFGSGLTVGDSAVRVTTLFQTVTV